MAREERITLVPLVFDGHNFKIADYYPCDAGKSVIAVDCRELRIVSLGLRYAWHLEEMNNEANQEILKQVNALPDIPDRANAYLVGKSEAQMGATFFPYLFLSNCNKALILVFFNT